MRGLICAVMLALVQGAAWVVAQECPQDVPRPATVTVDYGRAGGGTRIVRFVPDPAGVLRALDEKTGAELWAHQPAGLEETPEPGGRMGALGVLRFDVGLDGSIDAAAGDRVLLYFGLGRRLLALDVTDPGRAEPLWGTGIAELPGVGEIGSAPKTARVRIAGARQNAEHLVVITGGGYGETGAAAGNRLFILDAMSGGLLWHAGAPDGASPASLPLAGMTAAIPGGVAVLDMDGDRYADRMYAGDLAGQVWRFDLWNGEPVGRFATGGVIASLAAPAPPEEARRFFNAPDVALIPRRESSPYLNIALGSGDRTRPRSIEVHDRFYSLRDHRPHERLAQSAYDALSPVTDRDLFDLTGHLTDALVPPEAPGWKLELRLHGGWAGEKVLADSLTARGVVLFTTFQPDGDACAEGVNRAYALAVDQPAPTLDLDGDGEVTGEDVSVVLAQEGIAGGVELDLPALRDENGGSGESGSAPGTVQTQCSVGGEALGVCVPMERARRTFWQREAVD